MYDLSVCNHLEFNEIKIVVNVTNFTSGMDPMR
jgi:hypothetical protein